MTFLNQGRKKVLSERDVFGNQIKISILKKVDSLFKKGLEYYIDPKDLKESKGEEVKEEVEKKPTPAEIRQKAIDERNKKLEERKKALEEKKKKIAEDKEAAKKAKETKTETENKD